MKELFKKRFKKLTALAVALVMMLLPGQSLLVMAAETYEVDKIYDYYSESASYEWNRYYNKILQTGDTIKPSNDYNVSIIYDGLEESIPLNKDYKIPEYTEIYSNNEYELTLAEYFKGWQVSNINSIVELSGDLYADSNDLELHLSPVYQFAHVDDVTASNTDSKVIFEAKLNYKEIAHYYCQWGYAEKVEKIPDDDNNYYFIDPDTNELYRFTPIPDSYGSYDETKFLTMNLKDVKKGQYIVFRMESPAESIDNYAYYSNLAQVKFEYTVSYVKPDGTKLFDNDTGNSLEEFKITKTPSVDGYTFEGWYDNANCTGTKITSIKKGNEKNVTLYAKLTKKPATDTPSTVTKETYEKNSATMTIGGKLNWKGNKLVIKWGAVPGADGYDIIAAPCGKAKMTNSRIVETVPAGTTKVTLSKINGKKLKLFNSYKVQVKAFKGSGDSKQYIGESMVYHSAGKNSKFTNAKRVTLNKKKVTLKVGKTFKLSPNTIKQSKIKKLLSANHAPLYRYLSSDTSVATVNENGKIKAVGTGSCKVYAIAINGCKASISVTVK